MKTAVASLAVLTLLAASPGAASAENPRRAARMKMHARSMMGMMGPHAPCPHCAMSPGGHAGPMGRAGLHEKLFGKAERILAHAQDIELTDAQEAAVKKIKDETKKSMIRANAEIEVLKIDIHAALREAKTDRKAVDALIDKKYAAKKDLAKKLASAFADLKETLSESQWKSLKELMRAPKP